MISSRILLTLAERYKKTRAGRTGQANRDFLEDYEKLLKEAGCEAGEERVCAERDLQGVDGDLLTIERHRRMGLPLRVRFSQANENRLFALLGLADPTQERAAFAQHFQIAGGFPVPQRWRAGWEAFCQAYQSAALGGESVSPFDRIKPEETDEILRLLPRLLSWRGESLMRFASCLLCGSSKQLEHLERKLEICLEKITGGEVKWLSDLGIAANERSLLLHGPLNLNLDGNVVDLSAFKGPIRVSARDLESANFWTDATRCVTVENPAMLYELCKLGSGVILASSGSEGGFAHSPVITFLRKLPQTMECWHFGDSDPKGFDILRDLRERSGCAIRSLHMQFRTTERSSPALTSEQGNTIERLLSSASLTQEEKEELRRIKAAGCLGAFEQESMGLPQPEWPFFRFGVR